MSRYIVFEPPGDPERPNDRTPSDKARFVRDAFAGWALLFPFLWLFRHGLWLWGLLTLLVWIALGFLADMPGLGLAGAVLPILLGLLVALEGPTLRGRRLLSRRFRDVAVVEAGTEEEAAILYYAGSESNLVSRESGADSRETTPPPFIGRADGVARNLLDLPRGPK